MQESRRKETEAEVEKRKSEATSKDTLEDLEQSRRGVGAEDGKRSVPAPDGSPQPRDERADGSDTGDPM
jgi:hypothetical protein